MFIPRSSRQLGEVFRKILEDLRSQYVLGYVSDRPVKDGSWRSLEVKVKRPGAEVRHRDGYETDPPPLPAAPPSAAPGR